VIAKKLGSKEAALLKAQRAEEDALKAARLGEVVEKTSQGECVVLQNWNGDGSLGAALEANGGDPLNGQLSDGRDWSAVTAIFTVKPACVLACVCVPVAIFGVSLSRRLFSSSSRKLSFFFFLH